MYRLRRLALIGIVCAAVSAALLACTSASAQISVDFDQDTYFVNSPGDTIEASVLLDADASTMELDRLQAGLFSLGVATSFDSSKAMLAGIGDISPAAQLDFFGFNAGAFRSVTPGFGGVKGNIDQSPDPLVPYSAPFLARFTLTNLATAPDSYLLSLDFFRTVGGNEQLFLDGGGTVLDPQIQFGTALVIVVPEPPSAVLAVMLAVTLLIVFCVWRSRCLRSLG